MATLLIQSQLPRIKTNFVGAVRAIELVLLSAGLIYTIMTIFKASFGFVMITNFSSWLSSFSSSTLFICIFTHLVILLIAVSSLLHRAKTDSTRDDDNCVDSFQDYDLVRDFNSSSMSGPINLGTHPDPEEMKVKDIHEVVTSSKNQESDAVLDGFCRLSGAKEIKLAQTTTKSEDLEEDDSMEETWRGIMKRSKAQEKQLHKSETWPKADTTLARGEDHSEDRELRKSMTFNDAVTIIRCKGGLRRDPSTNREELNQRFEAFIQKGNREIRLQRQESEQRYLAMVSRGIE